jgi:hypothetical protein
MNFFMPSKTVLLHKKLFIVIDSVPKGCRFLLSPLDWFHRVMTINRSLSFQAVQEGENGLLKYFLSFRERNKL